MIDPLTPADAVRLLVLVGLSMIAGYVMGFKDGRRRRDLSIRWGRRVLRRRVSE